MSELAAQARVLPGFNHNVTYQGVNYHIQTEDYGTHKRCICSQIFLGGRVVGAETTGYPEALDMPEEFSTLVALLEKSHKAMFRRLKAGEYNASGPSYNDVRCSDSACESDSKITDLDTEQTEVVKLRKCVDMQNVEKSLQILNAEITGILGAALVDHESGMALGTIGNGINLEIAAAGNMEVVRAKMRVMDALGLDGGIEDILITLAAQFHIIRPVSKTLFLYVAIDRKSGNLAMARHKMAAVGDGLEL